MASASLSVGRQRVAGGEREGSSVGVGPGLMTKEGRLVGIVLGLGSFSPCCCNYGGSREEEEVERDGEGGSVGQGTMGVGVPRSRSTRLA